MKTLIIVNPESGGGSTGRRFTRLRPALVRAVGSAEEVFTAHPGHATELARRAVLAGVERLIVIGGDGTLNEVACGLFPADPELGIGAEPIRPGIVLAPVRRGTGGDLARLLGLPGRGPGLFSHLASGRVGPLDLGLCTFVGPDGQRRRRAFVNVASFGLTGLVDEKVNASGKRFGSLSFVGSIVSALFEYRRVPVRVVVDGESFHDGPLLLGAVGNGAYFGGGVRIAPDARLDDGRLEVVLLLEAGPREVGRALDVYSGRHVRWQSARVTGGRVIEADADLPCLLDLDGEQPGRLSARFEVLPGAAQIMSP